MGSLPACLFAPLSMRVHLLHCRKAPVGRAAGRVLDANPLAYQIFTSILYSLTPTPPPFPCADQRGVCQPVRLAFHILHLPLVSTHTSSPPPPAQINEAFASQFAYCVQALGIDAEKINPNGGGQRQINERVCLQCALACVAWLCSLQPVCRHPCTRMR